MARQTGMRFSDREETQRGSKDSKAVTKEGLTNKNDRVPSGKADYMKDMKSNISEALKDKDALDKKGNVSRGAAQANKVASISRAASRLAIGAGAPVAALAAGYGIGRGIGAAGGDEVVRKGIEKSGMGEKIDKAATGSRVELSKESKSRIAAGELEKGNDERVNKKDYPTYSKETKSADVFREEFKKAKESDKDSFSFEGRKYNTEQKLAKGGMVKANCGASVAPAQKGKK